jgi:hypothetical protein
MISTKLLTAFVLLACALLLASENSSQISLAPHTEKVRSLDKARRGGITPQRVAHLRSVLNALEGTETPENSGAIDVREVRSAMNGDETLRVDLQKPIPKWILYGTAVV